MLIHNSTLLVSDNNNGLRLPMELLHFLVRKPAVNNNNNKCYKFTFLSRFPPFWLFFQFFQYIGSFPVDVSVLGRRSEAVRTHLTALRKGYHTGRMVRQEGFPSHDLDYRWMSVSPWLAWQYVTWQKSAFPSTVSGGFPTPPAILPHASSPSWLGTLPALSRSNNVTRLGCQAQNRYSDQI